MTSNKTNILQVLNILQEYSDEHHIMTMGEIISKMKVVYDVSIDRRTVYSMVEALNLLGYEISTYKENSKGYYLITRAFEPYEVRLLTDRIYSMGFIPHKQANKLLEKLQNTQSVHMRKKYKHLKAARVEITENKQLFWTIEVLDSAIEKGKKVEFDYYTYNADKKLVPHRDLKYIVNPYQMVCANEKYYLVGNYDKYDDISHYRIDKIINPNILDEKAKPLPKDFDLTEYSNSLLYMFDGKREDVEIICDNPMAGEVIDRFGLNVRIQKLDENTFKLKLNAPPLGLKFWALQYLSYCEVIKPLWLREEIKESIIKNRYGD